MSKTPLRIRLRIAWYVLRDRGVAFNVKTGNGTIGTNKRGHWIAQNTTVLQHIYNLNDIGRDRYVWDLGYRAARSAPNPFAGLKYGSPNPHPGRYTGDVFMREDA
jgi:hypothetical protein